MKYIAFWLVGASIASSSLPAAELDYTLRAGARYSDNVTRQPEGSEESGTAAVAGVELRGEKDTGRLRYDIETNVQYEEYLDSEFDSGPQGRASLAGLYQISPGRFMWNAGLDFEQLRLDPERALAPGNREDRVGLSTGPTLLLLLRGTMEAQLDGQISRALYSDRPFDNQTLAGRVQLGRRANPRSRISVGAAYADVKYLNDETGISALDFNRREAFVRFELTGVRTLIELEAGYAEAEGDTLQEGGPLLRANLSRQFSPALRGFVSATREYPTSDPAAQTVDPIAPQLTHDSAADLGAGPRLMQDAQVGVQYDRPRSSGQLSVALRKETTYSEFDESRRFTQFNASLLRRFTPRTQGTLYGSFSLEKFGDASSRKSDEAMVGASFGVRLGRALGIDLMGEYRQRSAQLSDDDDSEASAGLYFTYSGDLDGR